jgi:hypothetical protein
VIRYPKADVLLAPTGVTVADLLAAESFPDSAGSVVYLAGSIVAGHANEWSDIDVFAVTDRPPATEGILVASTNLVAPHLIAGRRVDVEFWTPRVVEEMARRLDEIELGSGRTPQGATFLEIEDVFIHRLRTGVPLTDAADFARLRARFDFAKFAAFLTEESVRKLDALVEDLAGMHRSGDRDTALWVARVTLDTAVAAFLHSRGNTDPVAKWTLRHLAELDDVPLREQLQADYWALQLPHDATLMRTDDVAWRGYVERVVHFAEGLTAMAQGG